MNSSRANIELVLQLTLSILSQCNLRACAIGGVAALVHGIDYRDPKDVDLLVLNAAVGQDAEDIKRTVVEMDSSHFSLTPSRVSGATHRILWCTLSGDDPSLMPNGHGARRTSASNITSAACTPPPTCKVDMLTPDQLQMPQIPESQLYRDSENTFLSYFSDSHQLTPSHVPISYMPWFALLMLKLRAWVDHSLPSANEVQHGKIPQDEDDIHEILRVGVLDGKLSRRDRLDDDTWILGGFASWREAEQSVWKFVKKWPRTVNGWRATGFS